MDIRDAWDPFWGNVVSVIANDIKTFGTLIGFTPYINSESKHFVFPNWRKITDPIEEIACSDAIWTPSEDFTIDTRKIENGKMLTIYFHSALFDTVGGREPTVKYDVTMNRGLTSTIKDFDKKISEIWRQFLDETNGDELVRNYVEGLDRPELLQWLFEIDYLTFDDTTTCGMRGDEFERFINRLEELEYNLEENNSQD